MIDSPRGHDSIHSPDTQDHLHRGDHHVLHHCRHPLAEGGSPAQGAGHIRGWCRLLLPDRQGTSAEAVSIMRVKRRTIPYNQSGLLGAESHTNAWLHGPDPSTGIED